MDPKAITRRLSCKACRGRLIALLLLALMAAGLAACDETDPTGTDLSTSSEGAQVVATASGNGDSMIPAPGTAALTTLALPVIQSQATSGVLFGLTQTGAGPASFFKISNTANTRDVLLAQGSGSGAAVHGIANGTGGAGLFEGKSSVVPALTVIGNGGEGVHVQERGVGPAGFFENVNANSAANTLELFNFGKGKALNVTSFSNSVATFLLNNSGTANPALVAETRGLGNALQGIAVGGAAVRGIATTGIGGFFQNGTGATLPALLVQTTSSDFAARFKALTSTGKGVLIETKGGAGLQVVGGSKNAVVHTPSGAKALYTEESTEVWFTDYGFGRLTNGRGRILFDPSFAQTINADEPYHVFVQSYGQAELYVAERTPLGFTVVLKDGDSNAGFSYRIVAKRLGFERKRLEPAPWADHMTAW